MKRWVGNPVREGRHKTSDEEAGRGGKRDLFPSRPASLLFAPYIRVQAGDAEDLGREVREQEIPGGKAENPVREGGKSRPVRKGRSAGITRAVPQKSHATWAALPPD